MVSKRSDHPADLSDHIVLGNFSTDGEGKYYDDDRNRRFFVQPDDEPNFDLREGLDEFVDMAEHGMKPRSMESLLMWIRDHREELGEKKILRKDGGANRSRLEVDFMGRRGVLGDLLRSGVLLPKLEILVTLYRGTYYIESYKENVPFNNAKYYSFTGHKFRQLVTSVDGFQPDTYLTLNANEAYYAVMKASLGGERLLISSDVQGERQDSTEQPPRNYIAFKTKSMHADLSRNNKALQWWSLCFLAGIPEIVCGNRDDKRRVISDVQTYRTNDLPIGAHYHQEVLKGWTTEDCLKKLKALLADIKEKVLDNDPRSVYHLVLEEVEKGRGQRQRLQDRKFTVKGKRDDDYVILKDWYLRDVLGEE